MLKLRSLILMCMLCSILMTACTVQEDNFIDYDDSLRNSHKDNVLTINKRELPDLHPLNFGGTKWSTEDGSLWFVIDEVTEISDFDNNFYGSVVTPTGTYDVLVNLPKLYDIMVIADRNDTEFEKSSCWRITYTEEKLELTRDERFETFFEPMKDGFDTITLYSEPLYGR